LHRILRNLPHYFTAVLAIFAYVAWTEAKKGTKALEGQVGALQSQLNIMEEDRRTQIGLLDLGTRAIVITQSRIGALEHFHNWRR